MTGAAATSPAADFDECGWILVPDLFDLGEVAAMRDEAERLLADETLLAARGGVLHGPRRHDRLDPIVDLSPHFRAVAGDRRLTDLADRLLGGPAQLMKDKFIAKPPGEPGYRPHQDAAYWQDLGLDLRRVLTFALYLDPATAQSGAIELVSGRHREWLTEPGRVADIEIELPFETVEAGPGSVLAFHAGTPHRSAANRSENPRRTLFLSYAVDDRPNLYDVYQRIRPGAA